MRWWIIFIRGMWLPSVALVFGLLLSILLARVVSFVQDTDLHMATLYVPMAAFAAFAVLTVAFMWRLKVWETGRHSSCRICGGPLGWRRSGRMMYGKQLADFRRCYNCGSATPER